MGDLLWGTLGGREGRRSSQEVIDAMGLAG